MATPKYATTPYSPTRFPKGLTNANDIDAMGAMGQLDPTRFCTQFDDFSEYLASDWTITTTGTGTRALTLTEPNGALLITNSAAGTDANWYQGGTAVAIAANKQAFFAIRFKVSDAVESVFQAGLVLTDTTPLDATDGIFFQKADGAAVITATVAQAAAAANRTVNTLAAPLVNNTYIVLAFRWDGKASVEFYVNNEFVSRITVTSANIPNDLLRLSFGMQNGEAVAKNMTVDYVFTAVER